MKRSLGVIPRFFGFLSTSFLLFFIFSGVYLYSARVQIVEERGIAAILTLTAYPLFFASLLTATILVLLRLALSRVNPVPALLILWVLVVLMLGGVMPVIQSITEWTGEDNTLRTGTPTFPRDTVLRAGDRAFVVESQTGLRLDEVLAIGFTTVPHIRQYDHIYFEPGENQLITPEGEVLSLGSSQFPDQRAVQLPVPLAQVIADLNEFSSVLSRRDVLWEVFRLPALLELLSLTVLLVSLWTVARMSQWFLLNAALSILSIRGMLRLYSSRFFALQGDLLPSTLTEYGNAPVFAGIAVILILIALLLPPLKQLDLADEE